MITFGSDLMTKASADAFVADYSDASIKEINVEFDLYEVQVQDIENVGMTTYRELLDYSATLPYLELPVEEEVDEE